MKKFTLGKNLSRVGKILLAMVLTVALLLCSVIPSVAEDTAAESIVGYDTLNTHVYSPMDLIDGSTAASSPAFVNGTYDSSVWKFAVQKNADDFFKKASDGIAAPTATIIPNGINLSWENFDPDTKSYTVKVYGDGGLFVKQYNAFGTNITISGIEATKEYRFQVVSDNFASEILVQGNHSVIVPITIRGSVDGKSEPVMETGKNNQSFYLTLDETAKAAFNKDGAIVLEVITTLDENNLVTFTKKDSEGNVVSDENGNPITQTSDNATTYMNTYFYPLGEGKSFVSDDPTTFYANTGTNELFFIDTVGQKTFSHGMQKTGIADINYKNAHSKGGFHTGYIVVPLDDYDNSNSELTYDMISIVKETGNLKFTNNAWGYYFTYPGDTAISSYRIAPYNDRTISYPNAWVVSDYKSFVSEHCANNTIDFKEIVESSCGYNTMTSVESTVTGTDFYYNLTAPDIISSYNFHCGTLSSNRTGHSLKKRSIEYTFAENEKMLFGFTAPKDGIYEISAPISCATENAEINYAVTKTDLGGNKVYVQNAAEYLADGRFCNLQVALKASETVWLEAVGTTGAVLGIGLPQAILLNNANTGESTYTYTASDYMESYVSNGRTYGDFSATEDTAAAWDFGYFSKQVTEFSTAEDGSDTTNYDVLGISGLSVGNNVTELLGLLTRYELTNNKRTYMAAKFHKKGTYYETKSANGVTLIGDMSAVKGGYAGRNTYTALNECDSIISLIGVTQAKDSNTYQVGVYMKYTAPISGNAVLSNIKTEKKDNAYIVVIKGNSVVGVYTDNSVSIELGRLEQGETVTVCYTRASGIYNSTLGNPTVAMTGTYHSVGFDTNGGIAALNNGALIEANTDIVLPAYEKAGTLFKGWNMGENTYQANETVTVNTDMNLVALYDYYGDIDGDDVVAVSDLVKYKKVLLGVEKIEEIDSVIADINADESVNLLDFIRMKKWLAGIAVSLGKA